MNKGGIKGETGLRIKLRHGEEGEGGSKGLSAFRSFSLYLILFPLYFFLAPSAHAAIKSPPSNLGLVGYWSFDDCKGATSSDRSGYGNTGTLTNFGFSGSTSNWVSGNAAKRGCALNFDGVNDYVDATSTGLNLTTAFSLSAWIKPTLSNDGQYHVIVANSGNGAQGVKFYLHQNGKLGIFHSGLGFVAIGSTVLTINTWYHVSATYDGTTVRIYLNGILDGSGASSSFITSSSNVTIGTIGQFIQYFAGSIDEVRIYNRALSATEVTALYNSGSAKVKAPDKTGLVGHWTFDDGRGATSTDSSGQGNTGSLTNFALSTTTSNWNSGTACKRGGCLNFDGNDDRVDTTTNTALDMNATGWSLSAWANFTDRSTFHTIASKWDNPGTPVGWYVAVATDGKVDFAWNAADRYSTATVSTGVWHHIVATHDGATTGKIYIDGVLDSTHTAAILGVSTAKLVLGRVSNSFPMKGSIDDVRVYNRALAAAEVSTLYNTSAAKMSSTADLQRGTNLASGLVGHWTFDGKYMTTTTSTDTSGQGNNGTLTNGPVPTIGKLGQALSFNGTNSYVDAGDPAGVFDFGTGNFALSAWFKAPSSAKQNFRTIISNGTGFWIQTDASGFIVAGTVLTISNQGTRDYFDNQWHHVVYTRTGTGGNQTRLYVDGILEVAGTSASNVSHLSLHIGDLPGFAGRLWSGSLDDVRVYNRALSASEVQQLYGLGR